MHKKSVDIVNAGCQTDDGDLLLCKECEYPAETLYELGEHVGEYHTGLRIPCSSCPDIYTSKKELEKHESEEHNQYKEETLKDHRDIETFNCRFCEKNFRTKRELMKHNKKMHKENVSTVGILNQVHAITMIAGLAMNSRNSMTKVNLSATFVKVNSKLSQNF